MPFDSDEQGQPSNRRGGGPPGGSAFLSSRLRRSAEERDEAVRRQQSEAFSGYDSSGFTAAPTEPSSPAAAPAPAPASTDTHSYEPWSNDLQSFDQWPAEAETDAKPWESVTYESADAAYGITSDHSTASYDTSHSGGQDDETHAFTSPAYDPTTLDTPAADSGYDSPAPGNGPTWTPPPFPGGDTFAEDREPVASAATAAPASGRNASFPGGRVKLPRLGESPDNPDVTFVGTAFVRRPGEEGADEGKGGAFEEYFTYESLFDQPIADPLRTDSSLEGDDPYFVLGVDPEAPWRDIVTAHRALVKTHHPDRLIGASPQQLAESEEALRLVNRAYGELRRRGRDAEDDA